MLKRFYDNLGEWLKLEKVLVIYGPRRSGKTTLLKHFLENNKLKLRFDSGDNIRVQKILSSQDFPQIFAYVKGFELIVIDEAQQIPNIGMGLKIIVDHAPGIRVIAIGSSSFDLARQIGEPLTGRKTTITLYPISQLELSEDMNPFDLKEKLEEFLIFGSYPEVVNRNDRQEKIDALEELVGSYLFKDVLALEKIKGADALLNLLKLLAFQIGNEVSLNELATQLGVDVKTVNRYLDLLEKTFVIVRVGALSRNLRKEITKKQKYYFVDNGIRNAVISQFNSLIDRNDIGALWENFVFIERLKKRSYQKIYANDYFWRTYDQKEIDLIEERDGKLFGYEFKWSDKKNIQVPREWKENYPNSEFLVITPENYLEFVT
ncbi:MAG: ATP-binding protein [bacterium]|nr:ATP-binding protein [bacterium]